MQYIALVLLRLTIDTVSAIFFHYLLPIVEGRNLPEYFFYTFSHVDMTTHKPAARVLFFFPVSKITLSEHFLCVFMHACVFYVCVRTCVR